MPVKAIRPKRLYQQIAEQLFELIGSGEFVSGERLPPEHELARQLGVSRPSVREAMIVLEAAGMIEVQNGTGAFVRSRTAGRRFPWDQDDPGPGPLEQFRARFLLEPEMAAEAARFITDEEIAELERLYEEIDRNIARAPRLSAEHMLFHEKVAAAARNPFLTQVVRELLTFSRSGEVWKSVRARVDTAASLKKGQESRRRVLAALKRRDGRGARAALRSHFMRIGRMCFGDDFERPELSHDRTAANVAGRVREPAQDRL